MATRQSLDEHLAADRAQLAQREQLGDRLAVPRSVEHFAYFSRRKDAEAAAAVLGSGGFATTVSRRGLRVLLVATSDSDVLPETVERATRLLMETIESRGGTYDGWGGTVASKD